MIGKLNEAEAVARKTAYTAVALLRLSKAVPASYRLDIRLPGKWKREML